MTAAELAQINFDTALDQGGDDPERVEELLRSYHQNAIDSAAGHGLEWGRVSDEYAVLAIEFHQPEPGALPAGPWCSDRVAKGGA